MNPRNVSLRGCEFERCEVESCVLPHSVSMRGCDVERCEYVRYEQPHSVRVRGCEFERCEVERREKPRNVSFGSLLTFSHFGKCELLDNSTRKNHTYF